MSIFEGAGVALVTPFHEDGSVNYEKLEQIVEEQIAGGTDCIIACGTTGEAATLSHEEHIEVIRFVCQVVNKRIPVVAGTGSNCTETAVYLSTEAKKAGADGLLLVSPYYNKSTQKGLKVHFSEVAKAVDLPIITQQLPMQFRKLRSSCTMYRAVPASISPRRRSWHCARNMRTSSVSKKQAAISPRSHRLQACQADQLIFTPATTIRRFR